MGGKRGKALSLSLSLLSLSLSLALSLSLSLHPSLSSSLTIPPSLHSPLPLPFFPVTAAAVHAVCLPRSTWSLSPACSRRCPRHAVFLRSTPGRRRRCAVRRTSCSAPPPTALPACVCRGQRGLSRRLAAAAVRAVRVCLPQSTRSFSPACSGPPGLSHRLAAAALSCRLAAAAVLAVCLNEPSRRVSESRNERW